MPPSLLAQPPRPDPVAAGLVRASGYQPGLKVLDVGCGTGRRAAWFRPEDYTGLDAAPAAVEQARARHGGTFHVLPPEHVGALDERFDVILAIDILHRLPDAAVRATLAGLRRVLRPDGRLVVREPVWPGHALNLVGWLVRELNGGRHVRTRNQWCGLLAGHGWVVTEEQISRKYLVESFGCTLLPAVTKAAGRSAAARAAAA